MRYLKYEAIDPSWVMHHFGWQRGSDSSDILAARPDFEPLPYKGVLTLGRPGGYQAYELGPGGEPLRAAVVALLVSELRGERLPDELNGYKHRVKVDREIFDVTVSESQPFVNVTTYHGEPAAMSKVAAALDAAMATRQYDGLFTPAPPATQ